MGRRGRRGIHARVRNTGRNLSTPRDLANRLRLYLSPLAAMSMLVIRVNSRGTDSLSRLPGTWKRTLRYSDSVINCRRRMNVSNLEQFENQYFQYFSLRHDPILDAYRTLTLNKNRTLTREISRYKFEGSNRSSIHRCLCTRPASSSAPEPIESANSFHSESRGGALEISRLIHFLVRRGA